MQGRKPRRIKIDAYDRSILLRVARSRKLPWIQVQRARILLAIASGERVKTVAALAQCDPSTVRRICRRFELAGLAATLEEAPRIGRAVDISPCGARADRTTGLF